MLGPQQLCSGWVGGSRACSTAVERAWRRRSPCASSHTPRGATRDARATATGGGATRATGARLERDAMSSNTSATPRGVGAADVAPCPLWCLLWCLIRHRALPEAPTWAGRAIGTTGGRGSCGRHAPGPRTEADGGAARPNRSPSGERGVLARGGGAVGCGRLRGSASRGFSGRGAAGCGAAWFCRSFQSRQRYFWLAICEPGWNFPKCSNKVRVSGKERSRSAAGPAGLVSLLWHCCPWDP